MEFDLIAVRSPYSCSPQISTVLEKIVPRLRMHGSFKGAHKRMVQTFLSHNHDERGRRRHVLMPVPK